jgi:hypothetical protein
MLAKGGCPLLDLPTINPMTRRPYSECDQWRGEIMARLRTEHPQLIVLGIGRKYGSHASFGLPANFASYDPTWMDKLASLVRQLRGTGAKVLVLGPIPDPQSVVPNCLSIHLDDATACSPARSVAVNDPGIAAESGVVEAAGGQYADVTQLFCTTERCPAIVGNTLVYFNQNHLTLEYARLLGPVLGTLADRALVHG